MIRTGSIKAGLLAIACAWAQPAGCSEPATGPAVRFSAPRRHGRLGGGDGEDAEPARPRGAALRVHRGRPSHPSRTRCRCRSPTPRVAITVNGLPPGDDYAVALTADSSDGETTCAGVRRVRGGRPERSTAARARACSARTSRRPRYRVPRRPPPAPRRHPLLLHHRLLLRHRHLPGGPTATTTATTAPARHLHLLLRHHHQPPPGPPPPPPPPTPPPPPPMPDAGTPATRMRRRTRHRRCGPVAARRWSGRPGRVAHRAGPPLSPRTRTPPPLAPRQRHHRHPRRLPGGCVQGLHDPPRPAARPDRAGAGVSMRSANRLRARHER